MRKHVVVAGLSLLLMFSNVHIAAAESVTLGAETQGWYNTLGPCPAVGGCPTGTTTSRYPSGTLHVGVTLGQEDSRTYLSFDIDSLPASPSAGTLTLPIAGADAGTQNASAAQLSACLATEPAAEVEGSDRTPPAMDCSTNTTASRAGSAFTVDLAPFLARWKSENYGLAIIASEEARTPGTSWHVAFEGKSIAARFIYEISAAEEVPAAPIAEESSNVVTFIGEPAGPDLVSPPLPSDRDVVSVAPLAQTTQPDEGPGTFAYPAIFWVPLGILVVAGYLAYGLTRRIPHELQT